MNKHFLMNLALQQWMASAHVEKSQRSLKKEMSEQRNLLEMEKRSIQLRNLAAMGAADDIATEAENGAIKRLYFEGWLIRATLEKKTRQLDTELAETKQ
jgi:hypothetical protein